MMNKHLFILKVCESLFRGMLEVKLLLRIFVDEICSLKRLIRSMSVDFSRNFVNSSRVVAVCLRVFISFSPGDRHV